LLLDDCAESLRGKTLFSRMHLPKVSEMGEWVSKLEPQTYIQAAGKKVPAYRELMIKQSFFIHSTLLKLIAYLAALARNVCFMYTLSASTPRDRSKNFFLLLQFILLFILMKMNALIAALLAKRFFWRFYRACSGAVSRWSHVQHVGAGLGRGIDPEWLKQVMELEEFTKLEESEESFTRSRN
jgi:hypothetical protein